MKGYNLPGECKFIICYTIAFVSWDILCYILSLCGVRWMFEVWIRGCIVLLLIWGVVVGIYMTILAFKE